MTNTTNTVRYFDDNTAPANILGQRIAGWYWMAEGNWQGPAADRAEAEHSAANGYTAR